MIEKKQTQLWRWVGYTLQDSQETSEWLFRRTRQLGKQLSRGTPCHAGNPSLLTGHQGTLHCMW